MIVNMNQNRLLGALVTAVLEDRFEDAKIFAKRIPIDAELKVKRYTFQIKIPIDNYERTGVFDQELYCAGACSYSRQEWIDYAQKLHDEYTEMMEQEGNICYTGDMGQVVDVLKLTKPEDFPVCFGRLVGTNCFVEHPRWGRQSISVKRLMISGR